MPSSVIARMEYDQAKEILRIIFLSGNIYEYLAVPQAEYDAMRAATSKGTYLNVHIKGKYRYRKVA
ncbi:KTSC domain-containing protein [Taibaiella soli]|uniref:KTSC domain-containing protein n=2 Tax=Taibaiella soli TaxID=1649169 RepID=A0A2W2BTU9_9BACT|nr:KTSC domain-containing protein [Taibaiella soli]